jgi:hypothetical protein
MKAILVLVIALVSLTGCTQSATVESSSTFEELSDGSCNSDQVQLVQEHISAQINALSNGDWESAYSYASPGFREVIDLDQFTFILGADYQMLINNQGVQYGGCAIAGQEITQAVSVTSANEIFELSYSLSFDGNALGIESASTILNEPQATI